MLIYMIDHLYAMKQPATAPWGLRISDSDLERLKAGFKPKDQDDKWYFYVSATERPISVHIARSAFNIDFYVLHVVTKPSNDSSGGSIAEIASITWGKDRGCLSDEQAKKEAVMISRSVLGCDFDALPQYDL